MPVLYTADTHDQVLKLWRDQDARSLHLLHLDFHCDMRGLLINRRAQRAHRIWDMNPTVGQGNFLTHAILEGRIDTIRWVHGEPGGRQYDIGTVKYESDLSAIPFRFLLAVSRNRGIPLRYQALRYSEWGGLAEGECLDIDWDFFASAYYPEDTIQPRIEAFLAMPARIVPEETYVCYSPDFSHPSRKQFSRFVGGLASRYQAEVIALRPDRTTAAPLPLYRRYLPLPVFRMLRRLYYWLGLELRRRGIY